MIRKARFADLEALVMRDRNFLFTTISIVSIVIIFLNQIVIQSIIVGTLSSILYLLLNTAFLGHAVFEKETTLARLILGGLMLFVLHGLIGWIVMITYNIDITGSTISLGITAVLCSAMNHIEMKKSKRELK